MNYPFFESAHNFWIDPERDSRDFMYAMNRVYSLYPEQLNRCTFNFLDTHDTLRARNRCETLDAYYQQLTLLMTMPGSACIYYGTEIAMPGGFDPDCRRTMPWNEIAAGIHQEAMAEMKSLISLRRTCTGIRGTKITWHHDEAQPRLICFDRPGAQGVRVYIHGGQEPASISDTKQICYSRHYRDGILQPGGVLVTRL